MEINITELFNGMNSHDCSGSIQTHGTNAAQVTWQASKEQAGEIAPLKTPEQLQAARDYYLAFGAWEVEEINAWDNNELNAMLVQCIAGNVNDSCLDDFPIDWEAYEKECEAGQVAGNMFKGDDGEIYFYLGS